VKDWFLNLDDREQRFVAAAVVAVVIAMFYLFIWLPLDRGQKEAAASVEIWRTAVQQLAPLRGRVDSDSAPRISQQNLNQPLVVVVDSTLRVRNLNDSLQRSQPTGNEIRVEFENVSFDELIIWLGDLSSQYALQVQSGSFSTADSATEGRVDAQLTLGR
jgi:general secretion pathway protein M